MWRSGLLTRWARDIVSASAMALFERKTETENVTGDAATRALSVAGEANYAASRVVLFLACFFEFPWEYFTLLGRFAEERIAMTRFTKQSERLNHAYAWQMPCTGSDPVVRILS